MFTFNRLSKYGERFNTHDLIKVIAIFLMLIDHTGEFLLHDNIWCRLIGRGAAPLFFFLIGYAGRLHIYRSLIVYGVILTLSEYVISGQIQANVLFNFILIHYSFKLFPAEKLSTITRTGAFCLFVVANVAIYNFLEYGMFGLLIAYSAHMVALKDKQSDIWLMLSLLAYYLWESAFFKFNTSPYYVTTFATLTLCMFLLMRLYQLKDLRVSKPFLFPLLIVSRYSLEIYFLHLFVLELLFTKILQKYCDYYQFISHMLT